MAIVIKIHPNLEHQTVCYHLKKSFPLRMFQDTPTIRNIICYLNVIQQIINKLLLMCKLVKGQRHFL